MEKRIIELEREVSRLNSSVLLTPTDALEILKALPPGHDLLRNKIINKMPPGTRPLKPL